jgi:hypothetical protein
MKLSRHTSHKPAPRVVGRDFHSAREKEIGTPREGASNHKAKPKPKAKDKDAD